MGSRTSGREAERSRKNLKRLRTKLTKGKILTAAQHEYVETDPHVHRIPKRRTPHRCVFCGVGGHQRGAALEKSNGVMVRL